MKSKAQTISSLSSDLKRLETRAYGAIDWASGVLRRYHALISTQKAADVTLLNHLYQWMFVPPTLWPFNVTDVLQGCLSDLEKGEALSSRHQLLIDLLPETPDEAVCITVADHEQKVQSGSYENLVKTQAKFSQTERTFITDPDLHDQWASIKAVFDVTAYQDHKGVIRRTMGAERNMRPTFSVNMHCEAEAFQATFDAFCLRWNLYGMQKDEPLLLKLAVNITPYGTMIMIPSYWSLDPKRDIRWDAISSLHRARVPGRQGAALAEGAAQRMDQAKKLKRLDVEALRLKLKGEKKHAFLCERLGLSVETSPRRLSRLRALIPKK